MSDFGSPPFDLVRIEIDEHPVLVVYGELDFMTSPKLHDAIEAVVLESPKLVLIDMANVTVVDSAGLGALVVAQRHVAEAGGELRLVAVAPHPTKVFEITGLAERFRIFPDTESATASD